MDCRKFHKNLEDYLEGGLDFPGRFGIERHAQQCFGCGRELASAQKLGQMAHQLKRVSAPPDFEAAVLSRIHAKGASRHWPLRRFWIYGFDYPSWRLAALGASALALLGLGIFLAAHRSDRDVSSRQDIEVLTATPQMEEPGSPQAVDGPGLAPVALSSPGANQGRLIEDSGYATQIEPSGYVDYLVPGPGDRQMIVRLPKTILMRYGQPSEEYYIRNVSH
ncbi:MAG TPA: hypothetical protein VE398_09175 [Acidobacteriota bacterium]|nr:hypothetical protein [Acidobacteriota bacterium]